MQTISNRRSEMDRRAFLASSGAVLSLPLLGAGAASAAEAFPNKPVKMILPLPPGGAADRMLRLTTNRLEALWKQPVVIESKPGGGGVIGMQAVATSAPDGHTLGLTSGSLSINAARKRDMPYDTFRDLKLVARLGYYTLGLIAAQSVPADDLPSLLALLRKDPTKYPYASTGVGTPQNLAGEMFNQLAGLELTHIPYNGAGKLLTDMVGGRLPLCFAVLTSAEGFIKSGQVKVMGVTSAKRSPLFPQIPAIAEALPGYETVSWSGFVAAGRTPPALVQKLSEDVLTVTREPEFVKGMAEMGVELDPMGAAQFEPFVRDEIARYVPVVKRMGNF